MSLLDQSSVQSLKICVPSLANESNFTSISPDDSYRIAKELNFFQSKPFQWACKRALDYILGILALGLSFPLLLFLAIAIKIDSSGPVFFKQTRVGLNGKRFSMFKFRSMHTDAEERLEKLVIEEKAKKLMFKMPDDPRITSLGKILRKYSLDELPQLFNVLRGEMSLVGPRPPVPRELEFYKPWHYSRFATLPGMTGLWQVSGRSEITDFDQVAQLDFTYIASWNVLLDFKIIFRTIPVVLFGIGAY